MDGQCVVSKCSWNFTQALEERSDCIKSPPDVASAPSSHYRSHLLLKVNS